VQHVSASCCSRKFAQEIIELFSMTGLNVHMNAHGGEYVRGLVLYTTMTELQDPLVHEST
jgi:hypothetical protein